MITSFPKIFALGQKYISAIFDDEVEVTEKVDGSQFCFGKIDGVVYTRSKGRMIYPESVDKLFSTAIDYVSSIQEKLPDGKVFYCEYLQKPKHNALAYERTPHNNLILFGVSDIFHSFTCLHEELEEYAKLLDIEVVPMIHYGKIDSVKQIQELMDRESVLGGSKIEGLVVKNYHQEFLLGGQPIPIMAGKYVSEEFKEKHATNWRKEKTPKGRWETFKETLCTEARRRKAVEHLRDDGSLEDSPRDIGKIIAEIQRDVVEEEMDNIKDVLWEEFGEDALRYASHGVAEWYKNLLLARSLPDN